MSERFEKAGHKCEILKGVVDEVDSYDGFIYITLSAIKPEENWRTHIYAYMTKRISNIGGFIGGITNLKDKEGLFVFADIHCQV